MTKAELLKLLEPFADDQYVCVCLHDERLPPALRRAQLAIQGVEAVDPWHPPGPKLVGIQVHAQNGEISKGEPTRHQPWPRTPLIPELLAGCGPWGNHATEVLAKEIDLGALNGQVAPGALPAALVGPVYGWCDLTPELTPEQIIALRAEWAMIHDLPESCEVCGAKATTWGHVLCAPDAHNGRRFWRTAGAARPRCADHPLPNLPEARPAPGAVQALDATGTMPPGAWPGFAGALFLLDGCGCDLRAGENAVFVECLLGEVARNSRGEPFEPQPTFPLVAAPDAPTVVEGRPGD